MNGLKAIHIQLEGFSSFSRRPLLISGTQIAMPVPAYSTLLGMISCCAGKEISYKDTRIGFEFHCLSSGEELVRTNRLETANGVLKEHHAGQGILKQVVHFMPQLDLYLTNLGLKDAFENPVHFPKLGRSQDLIWIKKTEEVELTSTKSIGNIGNTLIPIANLVNIPPGYIVNHAEWFDNSKDGYCRSLGNMGHYIGIDPTNQKRFRIRMTNDTLYHPSNLTNQEDVIYLHEWLIDNN
jgi:hypothetical protein